MDEYDDDMYESWQEMQDDLAKTMTPEAVESAQLVIAMVSAAMHDDGEDEYLKLRDEVRANQQAFDCLVAFVMSTIMVSAVITGDDPEVVVQKIGQNFAQLRNDSEKYH